MVVTDTSALASTGHALLTVNVVSGVTYNLTFDVSGAIGYAYISGSIAAGPMLASVNGVLAMTMAFTANATGVVNIQLGCQNASTAVTFDNVYVTDANALSGDDSTFTASIGTWMTNALALSAVGGQAILLNTTAASTSITQTISLAANSRYQFELTSPVGGTFEVLDGATVVATATAAGIVKFSTTAATSYTLKFSVTAATLSATASISQVDIFPRLNALSAADSTFTSIANWKTTAFDNVYYAGNGIRLIDQLAFGAEISKTIAVVNGAIYRVQMDGSIDAQLLIGAFIGSSSLLAASGQVDAAFTANATSIVVTLRVNSNVANAEAVFRNIKIFEDNTHNVQLNLAGNSLASNGNIRAITSTSNTSKTTRSSISVAGQGTFNVKGDNPHLANAEKGIINALDASVACWMIDVPKLKPTATSLAYQITGVLR